MADENGNVIPDDEIMTVGIYKGKTYEYILDTCFEYAKWLVEEAHGLSPPYLRFILWLEPYIYEDEFGLRRLAKIS